MKRRTPSLAKSARGRSAQAGFSVLETLIAAALLFVVAVSIIPLFTRALQSNAAGGWSNMMTNFAGVSLESANQMVLDHQDLDLPVGGVLDLGSQYWNTGVSSPDSDASEGNLLMGDEGWTNDPTGPGLVLWMRRATVRKYSFADISIGTISSDGSNTLVPLGHPELFDSPLTEDDGADGYKAHLTEIRVTVQPCRGCNGTEPDAVLNLGQRMTVSHFRAY